MKLSISSCLLLTLAACGLAGDVYKILVVFPMPGPSSTILGDGVVKHLAAAGHEVTYITPIVKKSLPASVRQIDVSTNFEIRETHGDSISIKTIMDKQGLDFSVLMKVALDVLNTTYYNPNVLPLLLNPDEHFDLVISSWIFSEISSGFAAIFNAPYIWVSTVQPHWMALRLIGEGMNPAYNADTMTSSVPPFSFSERVAQLFKQIAGTVMIHYYASKFEYDVYDGLAKFIRLRGREPPSYDELKYNASLILGNSHVSMGQPASLPHSYKDVGGFHIDTKIAPLPADLQNLLENAKHGLIYFSMGSNLKSKDMPDELKRDLLKMFGTLKQTVLWKFEEVLPNLPSNVHIIKWAPQPSILAHPKCILFITHGGLLSTTETIHNAKPIIGIPVFGDQFVNVDRAVKKGFAKRVDLSYNMADDLKVAIVDILQDPSYLKTVQELSFIYHHRPASPGAELVHWAEHVIKTKGAPHLRSPAFLVPFYQKMYLDLIALIVALGFIIRAAFRRLLKKGAKKVKTN